MLSFFLGSLTLTVGIHAATPPNFPKLPIAFSTVVEANILNGNYTAVMSEMYDLNQSKSFRAISSSMLRGGTVNILDVYNEEQQWMWETNGSDSRPKRCQVSPISTFEFDLHGIHGMPSVNQFFGVKNASSVVFNGTAMARGIPCDVFVERVNFSRVEGMKTAILNYETRYFFSRQPWTWFRPESRIPVRIIIRGSHQDVSSNVSLNDFHTFEHYYEFVHFEELQRVDFTQVSTVVSSADTHLCDVTKYCMNRTSTFCSVHRGPPMPKIASTFSTHVESNFVTKNRTINSFEAFDGEHKVVHLRSAHHDHSHFVLADMEHNEVWIWDTKPGSDMPVECDVTTVRRATNPTIELFRHSHNAGPYHSGDFFTFGGALVNETYIGKTTVRGIPVRGWYRRIIQNGSAFHPPYAQEEFRMDVFYYFSEESWSYPPWNMSGIPVRIRVKGDAMEIGDGHTHTFDHVYDYIDFRSGHDQANLDESFNHDSTYHKQPSGAQEEHQFLPPIDWVRRGLCNTTRYCSGHTNPRKQICVSAPRQMPAFPQAWSTHVEANLMDKNRTINVFEAWDHDHQIYHQRQAQKDHTHRLLANLVTNETWIWDTKKEFGDALPTECLVTVAQRVSNPELRHLFFHSHDGHMYSSADFFKFGSPGGTKFVGEGVIRGIPVSIFSSRVVRNMTALHPPYELEKFDFTVFYYMSDPTKWKFGHLNGTNKVSVPVRVHVKGTGADLDGGSHFHAFEHVYEYSNFRVGEEEAHFDETFNHDKTHNEEAHDDHHAHEFLPPIDWVRKQKCNTTAYCQSGNPRKEVCQVTQLTSSGAASTGTKNCDREQTAVVVVGVVLGIALLISWAAIFYLWLQLKKGAHVFSD